MDFYISDANKNNISDFAAVKLKESSGGIELYDIRVSSELKFVRIEWLEPMLDHVSLWHPTCGRERRLPQFFCAQKTDACFFRGAPVLATVKSDGSIHRAVSLDDASVSSTLGYYVDDFSENDKVVFFAELKNVAAGYSTTLRIDKRNVSLSDALGDVWNRWNTSIKREAPLPQTAFLPLYSTWYSFHQTPEQTELTKELKLASEMGFKTVILDDGWQIEGEGTKNYRNSGDWLPAPDKFPDFKGFVDDVHSFGQKLILWFAVPFAGFDTEAFRRFGSKLLFKEEGYIFAGILDIRYPEVRDFIVGTYLRYIKDYGIDGLKLDFIDNFRDSPDMPPFNDEMDASTLTEAVKKLLEELCRRAVKIKPDLLMEFRQYYIGPEILRFCNMLRVGDCAFDAVNNRIGIADLRMMTRNVAVHSDMLLWSPLETPENCALQLLNVMFSVPQISIRPSKAGEEQLKTLKAFLDYHCKNRGILLDGRFSVRHPEAGYSAISAEDREKRKRITVLYSESAWRVEYPEEDIWNAAGYNTAALLNPSGGKMDVTVYNCFGEKLFDITTCEKALSLNVPVGGRITVFLQLFYS